MRRSSSPSGVITFILAVAILSWIGGFGTALVKFPPIAVPPAGAGAPKNFGLFNEAWNLIRSQFYGQLPTEQAITADSVQGVVSSLKDDPYAAYISASAVTTATVNFEPAWVPAIGTWILPVARGARVLAIDAAGVAAKSDMIPGDTIALVDDDPLAGLGRDTLVQMLDGKAGSVLHLVVLPEEGAARSVELTRATLPEPGASLRKLEADGVAVLDVPELAASSLKALDTALAQLASEAAEDSLVIDLRDNPGGPLADLPEVAGRFLKDGVIYALVDKDGKEQAVRVTAAPAAHLEAPSHGVVVLVNDGTYGTAEILAAALRDGLGARLVGEPSGGGDGLQSFIGLADGSQLRLTTAHWKSRAGVLATADGLQPDVKVTAPRAEASDGDPQLAAALSALKSARAAESASR